MTSTLVPAIWDFQGLASLCIAIWTPKMDYLAQLWKNTPLPPLCPTIAPKTSWHRIEGHNTKGHLVPLYRLSSTNIISFSLFITSFWTWLDICSNPERRNVTCISNLLALLLKGYFYKAWSIIIIVWLSFARYIQDTAQNPHLEHCKLHILSVRRGNNVKIKKD